MLTEKQRVARATQRALPENRAKAAARSRRWHAENRTRALASRKTWYAANKEKVAAKAKQRRHTDGDSVRANEKRIRDNARKTNPEKFRNQKRRSMGLPPATRPCPALCEACGRVSTRGSLCLDHDHNSGEFRGWLCDNCNRALGFLGDTARGVKLVLAYLQRAGDNS